MWQGHSSQSASQDETQTYKGKEGVEETVIQHPHHTFIHSTKDTSYLWGFKCKINKIQRWIYHHQKIKMPGIKNAPKKLRGINDVAHRDKRTKGPQPVKNIRNILKIKRRKLSSTPNTLEIDQFCKKATEVETPRTLWVRKGDATSALMAPASEMTFLKKYETAFLEIGREGDRGDTNKVWARTTNNWVSP